MYTHARQFPHLAGRSDEEIRALARRGMLEQPTLCTIMRIRNFVIVGGMLGLSYVFKRQLGWESGPVLMAAGAIGMAAVLSWNLVWVNTVVFRITKRQVDLESSEGASSRSQLP